MGNILDEFEAYQRQQSGGGVTVPPPSSSSVNIEPMAFPTYQPGTPSPAPTPIVKAEGWVDPRTGKLQRDVDHVAPMSSSRRAQLQQAMLDAKKMRTAGKAGEVASNIGMGFTRGLGEGVSFGIVDPAAITSMYRRARYGQDDSIVQQLKRGDSGSILARIAGGLTGGAVAFGGMGSATQVPAWLQRAQRLTHAAQALKNPLLRFAGNLGVAAGENAAFSVPLSLNESIVQSGGDVAEGARGWGKTFKEYATNPLGLLLFGGIKGFTGRGYMPRDINPAFLNMGRAISPAMKEKAGKAIADVVSEVNGSKPQGPIEPPVAPQEPTSPPTAMGNTPPADTQAPVPPTMEQNSIAAKLLRGEDPNAAPAPAPEPGAPPPSVTQGMTDVLAGTEQTPKASAPSSPASVLIQRTQDGFQRQLDDLLFQERLPAGGTIEDLRAVNPEAARLAEIGQQHVTDYLQAQADAMAKEWEGSMAAARDVAMRQGKSLRDLYASDPAFRDWYDLYDAMWKDFGKAGITPTRTNIPHEQPIPKATPVVTPESAPAQPTPESISPPVEEQPAAPIEASAPVAHTAPNPYAGLTGDALQAVLDQMKRDVRGLAKQSHPAAREVVRKSLEESAQQLREAMDAPGVKIHAAHKKATDALLTQLRAGAQAQELVPALPPPSSLAQKMTLSGTSTEPATTPAPEDAGLAGKMTGGNIKKGRGRPKSTPTTVTPPEEGGSAPTVEEKKPSPEQEIVNKELGLTAQDLRDFIDSPDSALMDWKSLSTKELHAVVAAWKEAKGAPVVPNVTIAPHVPTGTSTTTPSLSVQKTSPVYTQDETTGKILYGTDMKSRKAISGVIIARTPENIGSEKGFVVRLDDGKIMELSADDYLLRDAAPRALTHEESAAAKQYIDSHNPSTPPVGEISPVDARFDFALITGKVKPERLDEVADPLMGQLLQKLPKGVDTLYPEEANGYTRAGLRLIREEIDKTMALFSSSKEGTPRQKEMALRLQAYAKLLNDMRELGDAPRLPIDKLVHGDDYIGGFPEEVKKGGKRATTKAATAPAAGVGLVERGQTFYDAVKREVGKNPDRIQRRLQELLSNEKNPDARAALEYAIEVAKM